MDLSPGTRLDRYELIEPIGSGGQGAVWRVRDLLAPTEPRAVKLVDVAHSQPEQLERVRREARQLSRLQHPSIVNCHGLFEEVHRQLLGLVTTFVEGAPLSQLMANPAGFDLAQRMAILHHVADALAYVHAQGVIHRDLKPANILTRGSFLQQPGDPRGVQLIDFGIAFGLDGQKKLTQVGYVVGTPPYMAPETLDTRWGVSAPSPSLDVFAFGVLAWQLLIGGHPSGLGPGAEPDDYADAYRAQGSRPGAWLAALRKPAERGRPQEAWLADCLQLEPGRRLKTGAEILERLARPPGDVRFEPPPSELPQLNLGDVTSETNYHSPAPTRVEPKSSPPPVTQPGAPPENLPALVPPEWADIPPHPSDSGPDKPASPWLWLGLGLGALVLVGGIGLFVLLGAGAAGFFFWSSTGTTPPHPPAPAKTTGVAPTATPPPTSAPPSPVTETPVASCTGKEPLGANDVYDLQVSGVLVRRGPDFSTNGSWGRSGEALIVTNLDTGKEVRSLSGGKLRVKVGDLLLSGKGLKIEMRKGNRTIARFSRVRMNSSYLLCSNSIGYGMPLNHSALAARGAGVQARKFTFFLRPISKP